MGDDFQVEKYSPVSSINDRIKRRTAEDRKLRVKVEKVVNDHVNCTPEDHLKNRGTPYLFFSLEF
jgi:hypothetical protein